MSHIPFNMSRRRLLKNLVVLLVLLGLFIWLLPRRIKDRWQARPELDRTAPTGRLSEDDMATIVALAMVLIPADQSPGADEGWVRTFVLHRTEHETGYLPEYRNGAQLLDQLAQADFGSRRRFSQLNDAQREHLLRQHFDRGWLRLAAWTSYEAERRAYRVWTLVIKDLLQGFYRSAMGWAVVGYTHYPGVPGDPREYTVAPALHWREENRPGGRRS